MAVLGTNFSFVVPFTPLFLLVKKFKLSDRSWIQEEMHKLLLLFLNTRKYPLRGYILGVLTHTTALDRLWGGGETLTMWF